MKPHIGMTTSSICRITSRGGIRRCHGTIGPPQFMPFAAVAGYDQVVAETARSNDHDMALADTPVDGPGRGAGCRPEPWIQPRRAAETGEQSAMRRARAADAEPIPQCVRQSSSLVPVEVPAFAGWVYAVAIAGNRRRSANRGRGLHQASPQAARGDRSITCSLPVLRAWSAIIATNPRGSPRCRAHASSVMPDSRSAITCVTASASPSACLRSGRHGAGTAGTPPSA